MELSSAHLSVSLLGNGQALSTQSSRKKGFAKRANKAHQVANATGLHRNPKRKKANISPTTAVFGSVLFLVLDSYMLPYLLPDAADHRPLFQMDETRPVFWDTTTGTRIIATTSSSPSVAAAAGAAVPMTTSAESGRQRGLADGSESAINLVKEIEEPEIVVSGNIYVAEIAIVIILSLLFEAAQDSFKEYLAKEEKEVALDILDGMFSELTVLGFIGLSVFIATKTGGANHLAERLFPAYKGEGENPLAESFENIHMCIFAVMCVVMLQASTLMVVAEDLDRVWDRWESMSPKGASNSIESVLKRTGYISKDGEKQQDFDAGNLQERMWHLKGHKMMVRWHGLRHRFVYPVEDPGEDKAAGHIEVKDPASFDFRMYLNSKMGELLIELVEIDRKTWMFALLVMVPFVTVATSQPPLLVQTVQTVMGLVYSAIFMVLLYDLTRIEHWSHHKHELAPSMSEDAPDWLGHMAKTWTMAQLKMEKQGKLGRQVIFQGVGLTEEDAVREQDLTLKGLLDARGLPVELREQLLGEDFHIHEALLSPIHKDKMAKQQEIDKRIAELGSRDSYLEEVKEEAARRKRPWYVRWMGGDPEYFPHEHDQLFLFEEYGLSVTNQVMRTMMFMQAILVASLLVGFVVFQRTPVTWALLGVSLVQWPLQLLVLLPKVITKYVIVSSIEMYKDDDLIKRVTLSVKERRLRQAVSLMQMVKLRGRIERLGGHRLSKAKYAELQETYLGFPEEKQRHIEKAFFHMDLDHSGQIGTEELEKLMNNMNVLADSDVHKNAKQLVHMVDMDKDGLVDIDEFKALMALAYEKQDPLDEIADFDRFFELIDADMDEALGFAELASFCRDNFGLPLTAADVGELVYRCFRIVKAELTKDDFIVWMRWLQDVEKGPAPEELLKVDRPASEDSLTASGTGAEDEDGDGKPDFYHAEDMELEGHHSMMEDWERNARGLPPRERPLLKNKARLSVTEGSPGNGGENSGEPQLSGEARRRKEAAMRAEQRKLKAQRRHSQRQSNSGGAGKNKIGAGLRGAAAPPAPVDRAHTPQGLPTPRAWTEERKAAEGKARLLLLGKESPRGMVQSFV